LNSVKTAFAYSLQIVV